MGINFSRVVKITIPLPRISMTGNSPFIRLMVSETLITKKSVCVRRNHTDVFDYYIAFKNASIFSVSITCPASFGWSPSGQ